MNISLFYFRLFCLLLIPLAASAEEAVESDLLSTPKPCLQYAEFRQEKTLHGLPRPLVTRGRILVDCNRGTLWSTRTPISETLVYRFSGKHWLVKADGEVQLIKNAAQKRIGDILARIVRGDREFVDNYFHREIIGKTTRLVPAQKRLQKYIDNITLDEIADGLRVSVARADQHHLLIEIFALRELPLLDAQSCRGLLETDVGCDLLLPSGE